MPKLQAALRAKTRSLDFDRLCGFCKTRRGRRNAAFRAIHSIAESSEYDRKSRDSFLMKALLCLPKGTLHKLGIQWTSSE